MSLLMKALEKAAKDREETDEESTAATKAASATAAPMSEITLEPLQDPAGAPQRQPAVPREPGQAPRNAPRAPADADAASSGARDAAQAAVLLRAAKRETGSSFAAYMREHPLIVFGGLASLFLLAYGTYVYLQMTNPGMFIKQTVPPPSAQIAPPPVAPPGAATGSAARQPLSTTLVLPSGSTNANLVPPTLQVPPVSAASPGASFGTRGLPDTSAPAAVAATAAAAMAGPTANAAQSIVAAPAAAPPPAAPREAIRVTRGGAAPTLNPVLAQAYQALDSGNIDSSQRLYSQVLQGEPNNIDALLGSAAIAAQKGDSDGATKHYMTVLQVDPRNTLAQAGLIGMLGRADPLAAETRVKQLIGREPSAYLYFTLGNVYVDQNRWPDAQQAYFQAHHMQPDNPDYAYNLAVGLEHLGQPKLALSFYRRATQLAAAKGRANFSTGAALERISQLEKFVE